MPARIFVLAGVNGAGKSSVGGAVYDNSAVADPKAGQRPLPSLFLNMQATRIVSLIALDQVPQWAKPVVVTVLELQAANGLGP
ncbi:MAG: hypothetical protein LH632_09515 [Rhodoferax sp.]|nr:hypothetical protein [Rhodoferax sp.]